MHVLLQFEEHPDAAQRAQLENDGIRLLLYLPDHAWHTSVPVGMAAAGKLPPGARWMGAIEPGDKIDPTLRANPSQADAPLRLVMIVYPDVDMGAAERAVEARGGTVLDTTPELQRMHVKVPDAAALAALAASDLWYWIAPEPPPPKTLNDGGRAATKTDQVHALGFHGNPASAPGSIVLGVWDGGSVDPSHPGFAGRLTLAEPASPVNTHATHVAGTMAGSGASSPGGRDLRGHADQATIISYDFYGNVILEHGDAIGTYDIDVSQNSWGPYVVDCNPIFGDYSASSHDFDLIVRGYYTKPIAIAFAAGNEQTYCDPHWTTIGPEASAKNVIAVGATHSDDKTMTDFSSWGPADDGRVKPDVVAPGDEAGSEMAIWSALGYAGWAVGNNGTILRTHGGGRDWITQTAGIVNLYGVYGRPNDESIGWSVGAGGVVSFTYDGGDNWLTVLNLGPTITLTSVYLSSGALWTAGTGGYVFHGVTGPHPGVVAEDLQDIYATDDQTAWAVGEGGRIISTTNGASTWVTQTSGTTADLFGVSFADADTGWAVGEGGIILYTTNGGATWSPQDSTTSEYLLGVFATDTQTVWVVGDVGTILHTANGGDTWTAQTSGTDAVLLSVFAADDQTAWAVGDVGTILHTTNGGDTWTAQDSGTEEVLWDVFFSYSGRYGGDKWEGTSMATPAVSGILGLMLQAYNTTYGSDPWPSTLKAILMHTAEDLGNAGPDYKFGYGHVDALAAVNLITDTTYFTQDSVEDEGLQTYTFSSDGAVTPTCTLVWDDVPGTPGAAPALVNDLDLRLVAPDDTNYLPWVLDKDNPDDVATRGDNNLDNVEQVVAPAPQAGTWSIRVSGDSVPLGPQGFSLVCNSAFQAAQPEPAPIFLPFIANNYDPDQLLQNRNFTGAWTPWETEGAPELSDQVYRSAPTSAQLLGRNDAEDQVWQGVIVPSDTTQVTLDFWYRVSSDDSATPEDYMCAGIADSEGELVSEEHFVCYDLYYELQDQWLSDQLVFTDANLTPLLGQTVFVTFLARTNATGPSTVWVDD
ncbi:MAG: S8 family serine peptidase, partial [Anaerolineae bacterium]